MSWSEHVETLQNMIIAHVTGGEVPNNEYTQFCEQLLLNKDIGDRLPRFVRTCRDVKQVWAHFKQYPSYAERRRHIWEGFRPVLDYLASQERSPADALIAETLSKVDADHVRDAWQKALDRRAEDPDGAITTARTLMETVCKCILDNLRVGYDAAADLPKLYRAVAENLDLAPDRNMEDIFRRIFGACQAVVEGLGALRNRIGDSHGQGKDPIRPDARHAELAVNLAGTMSTFLVATWEAKKK